MELTSGESLYIPPYWLVRVENIELSLYLDVKSLSKEQVLLSEAQSLGVVLGNVTTPDERIIAAQVEIVISFHFDRCMLYIFFPESRVYNLLKSLLKATITRGTLVCFLEIVSI